ncbi:GP179 protein, partial [Rynchops niger]|nr:GP179 protein [Rynchops niger]
AGLAEGLEVGSRSIRPQDHVEVQQPSPKPIAGSPDPSTAGAQRAAAERPGAEVCPPGAPRVPAGKAALLCQEVVARQEDRGVPQGRESPAKALGKGGSRPAPPRSVGTQRVPAKSQSTEVVPAAAGKGRSTAAEVCPGETRADSRIKTEVRPWEESGSERWGPGRAPRQGGSKGDGGHPGEEPGTEKAPAKTPQLPKAASERAGSAEGRTAEVCPWESGEGGRSVRAEICPWDAEGAAPEREGQEGERRRLGEWRGSPSPGEGAEQPGIGLLAKPPALPKTSPRQEGTISSKKAHVCPWEEEDQPLPKTEICPWEDPAAPSGKERPRQDTRGTSKGENKPGLGELEDIKAKLAEAGGCRPE